MERSKFTLFFDETEISKIKFKKTVPASLCWTFCVRSRYFNVHAKQMFLYDLSKCFFPQTDRRTGPYQDTGIKCFKSWRVQVIAHSPLSGKKKTRGQRIRLVPHSSCLSMARGTPRTRVPSESVPKRAAPGGRRKRRGRRRRRGGGGRRSGSS